MPEGPVVGRVGVRWGRGGFGWGGGWDGGEVGGGVGVGGIGRVGVDEGCMREGVPLSPVISSATAANAPLPKYLVDEALDERFPTFPPPPPSSDIERAW